MNFTEIAQTRQSCRAYDKTRPVEEEKLSAILEAAKADGFSIVIDGTNASDDASDRPGMVALRELQVRSPLREASLTKAEIRRLSKSLKDSSDSLQTSFQKANDTMDSMTDLIQYLNDNPAALIRGRGVQQDAD